MPSLPYLAIPMSPDDLQEGLARLSRGGYFKEASLDITLSLLTEAAGQMGRIERTSIWALTDESDELRCLDLYELSQRRHSSGGILRASDYPAYFGALAEATAIIADHPYLHPSTTEFAGDYLPSHSVLALLDTPIHVRGELQGILRFEQTNAGHAWSTLHCLFAQAVANLVTVALVEHEAEEARRQSKNTDARLRAVLEGSRDALLLADAASAVIIDANRKAEKLFGCTRLDLIGRHLGHLPIAGAGDSGNGGFRRLMAGEEPGRVITATVTQDDADIPVEITAEISDSGLGGRLALGIFRATALR